MKNVEEILSVPGIGVVFVGPNDLSWSLGVPQGSPEHNEAVQTVLNAAMKRNIPAAITVTEADVVSRLKQGFRIASLPSGGLEQPMDATLKLARTVIGNEVDGRRASDIRGGWRRALLMAARSSQPPTAICGSSMRPATRISRPFARC